MEGLEYMKRLCLCENGFYWVGPPDPPAWPEINYHPPGPADPKPASKKSAELPNAAGSKKNRLQLIALQSAAMVLVTAHLGDHGIFLSTGLSWR